MDRVHHPGRGGHEAESIHGRADRRDNAGAGGQRRRRVCAASMRSAARPSTGRKPSTAVSTWSDAKRLKALEDESNKLKKLLADAELDKAMLKEIASKKEWWHLPPGARPWPACVPRSKRASGGRVPLRGRIARRSALETLFASLAHARDVLSLGMTTTPSGRTRAPRQSQPAAYGASILGTQQRGRCATLRIPRPVPLFRRAVKVQIFNPGSLFIAGIKEAASGASE